MIRKLFLLCAACLLIFNSCKKSPANNNADTTIKISAAGSYLLTSVTNGGLTTAATVTYTSELTPCLANNKMNLKSDGTSNSLYSGTDDCYVSKSATSSTIIGTKGDATTSSWVQTGNRIKLNVLSPYTFTSYGEISNTADGKVQIVFRDTIKSIGSVAISIYIKQ